MRNNAIILCSGIGRRMSPIPKCNKSLLCIRGEEPNIKRICRILSSKGISPIVIAAHPDNEEEFTIIQKELLSEDIPVVIQIVDKYTEGCNNIVSLQSVSKYIKDTFIIEGDQYLLSEHCGFLREDPYPTSRFFTQRREFDDWAVCEYKGLGRISRVLHHNPNPSVEFCLAGISYISKKDSISLRVALDTCKSKDIYWEEVIDFQKLIFTNHKCYYPYALEYDNIHDLIRKDLMDPQSIANLIDEDHQAKRLDSMTNTSYLVKYEDSLSVLRIPGYGTERFVNRQREATVEDYISKNTSIAPHSVYYSDNHVKLTEYLDTSYYHVMNSMKEFPEVLRTLEELHHMLVPEDLEFMSLCTMNVEKELSDYESIFLKAPYSDYWKLREKVLKIVENYPYTGFVHRDLVPRNILVSNDKDVKLIDWEYACIFNKYWDLASLACEYVDEYACNENSLDFLEHIVSIIYAIYPDCNIRDIYQWIAVVDFVWSSWSLAKLKLGDNVAEYLDRRYNRCRYLLSLYYKE